ncbi:MAG: hypothetical protein ACYCWW_18305, partial [Deltaproteobacteria bacterium]
CLPWCDIGNQSIAPCAAGQVCVSVGGALVSSTANDNGTGVCTEGCNPYLDASHDSCAQGPSGTPRRLCKAAGSDNDIFPSPGVCVGGSPSPTALGQPCDPFGWVDPCPSGAICAAEPKGNGFVCAQLCDPSPSPGSPPQQSGCPSGLACSGLGPPTCLQPTNAKNGYACYHVGACL